MQEISEVQKQIERFISYYQFKFQIIKDTKFKANDELFKKILYIGIIDALSKTVFSEKRRNRERFVLFLEKFSGWENCNRISLPHLIRLLEFTPEPEYSKIKEFAFSNYRQWVSGNLIGLEMDLEYKEVIRYWPKGQENTEPIKGVKLSSLKHIHLFYTYRNSFVHELRNIAYGIEEISLGRVPSYQHLTDENNEEKWLLIYPFGFFENICETCLKNLKRYLIKNDINPYKFFNFGYYWKEELNQ